MRLFKTLTTSLRCRPIFRVRNIVVSSRVERLRLRGGGRMFDRSKIRTFRFRCFVHTEPAP